MSEQVSATPPQTLGRYQLGPKLGQGGMGTVYRARDPQLDRDIALKVLLWEHLTIERHLKRFVREIKTLAALQHPSIVRIYDSGECEGWTYFAMELLQGATLADVIADQGPLANRRLVQLATDIGGALASMHQAGLVHRDLKPANVFVCKDGSHKLMDLGLVKSGQSTLLTAAGHVVGTPRYIPPEVLRGGPHLPQGDVYQLGILLYEAATGEVAFGQMRIQDAISAMVRGDLPSARSRRASIPASIDAAIMHSLDPAPQRRTPSAQDLVREIAQETEQTSRLEKAGQVPQFEAAGQTPQLEEAERVSGPGARGERAAAARGSDGPARVPTRAAATPAVRTRPVVPPVGATSPSRTAATLCAVIVLGGVGALARWHAGHPGVIEASSTAAPRAQTPGPSLQADARVSGPSLAALDAVNAGVAQLIAGQSGRDIANLEEKLAADPMRLDLAAGLDFSRRFAEREAEDLAAASRYAAQIEALVPDLSTATPHVAVLLLRCRGVKLSTWLRHTRGLQVMDVLDRARREGRDSPSDILWIGSKLEEPSFPPEGIPLIAAYLDGARVVVERAASAPETFGADLGRLLGDLRWVAFPTVYTRVHVARTALGDQLEARSRAFLKAMKGLSGPAGRAVGGAAADMWTWGYPLRTSKLPVLERLVAELAAVCTVAASACDAVEPLARDAASALASTRSAEESRAGAGR